MPSPSNQPPGVGRTSGASRLGLVAASIAAAGSFAVAFAGLGGPPADPAPAASATPVAADPSQTAAPVTTIYVHLPAPTAAPTPTPTPTRDPVVAPPQAQTSVVTRQSGTASARGAEGGTESEQEGND